jgi:hypothetical protein
MNIDIIITLYTQQLTTLRQLLEVAREKKAALISAKHDVFEIAARKEEKLLSTVQNIEKQRSSHISGMLKENFPHMVGRTNAKLSILLKDKVAEKELSALANLEDEIKKTITELNEQNSNNLFLLHHLRNFYAETMQALVGKNLTSIIDRRV